MLITLGFVLGALELLRRLTPKGMRPRDKSKIEKVRVGEQIIAVTENGTGKKTIIDTGAVQ